MIMKRIAICTLFYKNYNYGGILQAYALQYLLRKNSFEAEVIAYDNNTNKNPIYPTLLSYCSQYSLKEIITKILEKVYKKTNKKLQNRLSKRYALYNEFVNKNIVYTPLYSDETLVELGEKYDVYISGSDQIWNPNAIRKLYLLEFPIKKESLRISYAASISRKSLDPHEIDVMLPSIAQFDHISVRERTAKILLSESGIKKTINVVCDPTILLSARDWDNIAAPRIIQKPYVIVYAFSEIRQQQQLLEYYRNKGIECYYIPYVKNSPNSFDHKSLLKPLFDVGPAEFISLIKYAENVITDSFHGTVFSIIYQKQFIVFERDKEKNRTSKNSRIYDLLEDLKLEGRLVNNDFISIWSETIDYTQVYSKLKQKRDMSFQWLINAINE